MNRASRLRSLLLPALLVASATQGALADITTSLGNFGLITSGDLADTNDVQGRVLVGGTLNSNAFTFGGQLSSTSSPYATTTNGVFNKIGPNIANFNNNSLPNVYYASSSSGYAFTNATNNPTKVASFTTVPGYGTLANYLSGLSGNYAGLASNSTVSAASNNTITFTAAAPTAGSLKNVAVFSIASSFFTNPANSNASVVLSGLAAGQTAVINVTGPAGEQDFANNINFNNFTLPNSVNDSANILFNFEDATKLVGIPNLNASILAPNAILESSTASLVGGVYVGSVAGVQEIDLARSDGTAVPGFSGFTPAAVPEPASLVMVALGGALAVGYGVARRRRPAA